MKLAKNILRKHSEIAFTLLELLIVLAIIALLASITFGTAGAVKEARMKSTAKAELTLLSQALESYKFQYGDYPITSESEENSLTLSKSLLGYKDAKYTKSFIDASRVYYEGDIPIEYDYSSMEFIRFIDPWGNSYQYFYKDSSEWDNFDFILYSKGPNGMDLTLPKDGLIDYDFNNTEENADNIYIQN